MTVEELIAHLANFNPKARVVVDGYEGGYQDVIKERIGTRRINLNVNEESYYGPHEGVYNSFDPYDEIAVLIRRG